LERALQGSVRRVLRGEGAGQAANDDHRTWYRELLSPSVTAGLLRPAALAGCGNGPVYARKSMPMPLNRDALWYAMPAFF
jgi:hypothetical protein